MNFMFSWQEQYLTSERSERVRYCSCHENIEFLSSRHRVISSISLFKILPCCEVYLVTILVIIAQMFFENHLKSTHCPRNGILSQKSENWQRAESLFSFRKSRGIKQGAQSGITDGFPKRLVLLL